MLPIALALLFSSTLAPSLYAEIRVVDETTDRGVPLVELESTNSAKYVTDNDSSIAIRFNG